MTSGKYEARALYPVELRAPSLAGACQSPVVAPLDSNQQPPAKPNNTRHGAFEQ